MAASRARLPAAREELSEPWLPLVRTTDALGDGPPGAPQTSGPFPPFRTPTAMITTGTPGCRTSARRRTYAALLAAAGRSSALAGDEGQVRVGAPLGQRAVVE